MEFKIPAGAGCTDSLAFNYSLVAIIDDNSCCYISGCSDFNAFNYDSNVCFDDGSCIPFALGCTDTTSVNFDINANTSVAFGGPLDNTFGTGGYYNGDRHLIFDSYKECIIKSAIIDVEAATSMTFELRNNAGNVIDDTTLSLVSGSQRVDLNFNVPIESDMQLGVTNGALQNIGLYRNSTNAIYPYNIASAMSITSSSAIGYPGYYYFFYSNCWSIFSILFSFGLPTRPYS